MIFHEVVEIFPPMTAEEFEALKADIKANGQLEPIWTYREKIVDGRNRYNACIQLDIEPKFREWNGQGSLVSFVWSLNGVRRHLTPGMLAGITVELMPVIEAENRQKQLKTLKQNMPVSHSPEASDFDMVCERHGDGIVNLMAELPVVRLAEGVTTAEECCKAIPREAKETVDEATQILTRRIEKGTDPIREETLPRTVTAISRERRENESATIAAKITGASTRYVQEAKAIQQKSPELFEQIKTGEKTIPEAKRELRKAATVEREQQALAALPVGEKPYVITADQTVVKCQATITDPPYGILDQPWEPAELEKFTREWLARWNECGANFMAIFWSSQHLFEGRVWFDAELTNYRFQQLLIWHYANNKKPSNQLEFKRTYEVIFLYRQLNCELIIGDGRSGEWRGGLNTLDCHSAGTPQGNCNDQNMKQHPAQKPVSVMKWLVNALTQPGDLVCDPFCGSGTTGIAALKLTRRFHGIEISAEYRELAERRIATYGTRQELDCEDAQEPGLDLAPPHSATFIATPTPLSPGTLQ